MKRAIGCLLLWLGALMPVFAASAELGRLFLSPAERTAIDLARQAAAKPREIAPPSLPSHAATRAELEPDTPAEPVTVNGYIARSAGAATVWVNGHDAPPAKLTAPTRDGRRVSVPLTNGHGQVALKPGQSFDPESHQISDAYQQRSPPRE